MIICSAAHRRHDFVLVVFSKEMGFCCQMILTLKLNWHQSATLAFVLNWRCLACENKCHARAEQFSCLGT